MLHPPYLPCLATPPHLIIHPYLATLSYQAFHELEAAVTTLHRGSAACAAAQQPERAAELRMMAMVVAGSNSDPGPSPNPNPKPSPNPNPNHIPNPSPISNPHPTPNQVVAGYQPGAQLWSAAVQSTAQGLASPHLRLLLTVLGSAHAAATAAAAAAAATATAAAAATADVDAAAALSPTAATAAVSAPALALDALQTPPAAGDGGDELSHLLLHMLLEPAGAAGGGGGGSGPLLFADGLAVACRFLPDAPLRSLLPRLLEQAVGRGSLQGLCLCGMGEGALPLLQAAASNY